MKKTALTMAVVALGGLMSTGASAAPLAAGDVFKAAPSSHVEHVRHRDGDGRKDRWDRNHDRKWHRHHKHGRYDRYRGWHRYSYRPYNWRTRGCVIVGPVWFCP